MSSLFAILPYIRTKKPLHVAGVSFRNSQNIDGLTAEEIEHLKSIVSLFYLADDKPIEEVVYAVIHLSNDRQEANLKVWQLRAAHTILSYLVTRDHYDSYERTMLYLLLPAEIIGEKSLAPGYSVTVNWLYQLEIPRGGKIYPPHPYPVRFIPQGWNLSDIPIQLKSKRSLFYGLEGFVEGEILDKPEQRERYETLLQAMSWYNRSFSLFVSEEEKIVYIAVAFEILFHHQESSSPKSIPISQELKDHLWVLFGDAIRLNEWVDQFYNARSNILHKGSATTFHFVIGDKRFIEKQLAMESLLSYGRRLLRMCILNILHGTALAEEAKLNAWFMHDRERLEEISENLRQADVPAEKKIFALVPLLFDLDEHWLDEIRRKAIDIKSIFGTGKLLIQTFLEAYPETEDKLKKKLKRILSLTLDKQLELVNSYSDLYNELSSEMALYEGNSWPRGPRQVLTYFAQYAGSPILALRIISSTKENEPKT